MVCNKWLGYSLSLKAVRILFVTSLYASWSEHALSNLVSSPLTRLEKMFLGWAELYSRYWNLFVGLKKGLKSSMREDVCLFPL